MYRRKTLLWMLVFVLAVGTLSACSGQETNPEEQPSGQKKENSADVSQFEKDAKNQWKEAWSETLSEGATSNINIYANIELPDVSQMSAVEVQKYLFNEENKKKLTESIFGSEVYYHDEAHLTRTELEPELEIQQQQVQTAAKDERSWIKKRIRKYKKLLKNAPENHVKVTDDYTADAYMGKRDGTEFTLTFGEQRVGTKGTRTWISLNVHNKGDTNPESVEKNGLYFHHEIYFIPGDNETTELRKAQNKCSISKEEAEKQAREFLQNAGFPELVKTEEGVVGWDQYAYRAKDGSEVGIESEEEDVTDGWAFEFSPGVDGISFRNKDMYVSGGHVDMGDTMEMVNFDQYSNECYIEVQVTDKGVIEVEWNSPVMVMSATPSVKLMSLDVIKKIVREEIRPYLEYCYERKNITAVKFNRMSLVYYRVADPHNEDLFTYIPAWWFWSNDGRDRPNFVVNAMDGSIVDDWEETWNLVVMTKEEYYKSQMSINEE